MPLVEFVMGAEVKPWPAGGYALVNYMRHNLYAAGDLPMHVVLLKPGQVGRAAKLSRDQVVTVRARVVGCEDGPGGALGKVVALKDGEIVATMRYDAKTRTYVPE